MNRYWRGTTKDDKFVTEAQGAQWIDVAKDLISLELVLEDRDAVIKLPDDMEYVQAKTCGADLASGKCDIESRYIGYVSDGIQTIIRVNEATGHISVEHTNRILAK